VKNTYWVKLFATGIVLTIISALSEPAISCTRIQTRRPSACEAFQSAEIVFLGTAIEELKPHGIRFHIDRSFKGETGETFDVFSELMCGTYLKYEKEKQYVIYASPFPANGFHFNDRSNLIEEAGEDEAFLKWYGTENAFGYISGTIRIFPDAYNDSVLDHLLYSHGQFDGEPYSPLGKGTVRLWTKDKEFSLTTDQKGHFSVGGLPAGIYHIEVLGYSIRLEPEIISLPQNGCSEANLFVKATH
jgi:hypothetical protein